MAQVSRAAVDVAGWAGTVVVPVKPMGWAGTVPEGVWLGVVGAGAVLSSVSSLNLAIVLGPIAPAASMPCFSCHRLTAVSVRGPK